MLRYLTSGESHGECLIAILEGMPSGLSVTESRIETDLKRRMVGFGRGKRMKIEKDKPHILSGVRRGKTIGSPIAILIENADCSIDRLPTIKCARPGHADLTGALKYDHRDIRNVLERSSARETAARVAVGALAKMLLSEFGIDILSHVTQIGNIKARTAAPASFGRIRNLAEKSPVRCADKEAAELMCELIGEVSRRKDTLGGEIEVIVRGVPPGLGSYVHWDRKLDALLAGAVASIQAIKAVSFGKGAESASLLGSEFHDEIFYSERKGFFRKTDNAGGIEGGMTNGQRIIIRASMKPISTLMKPLKSVNIATKRKVKAAVERSDICAVPAAGVVAEAVVALEIANALLHKIGGDSMKEMRRNYKGYKAQVDAF